MTRIVDLGKVVPRHKSGHFREDLVNQVSLSRDNLIHLLINVSIRL